MEPQRALTAPATERGSGLLSTLAGITVFLVLLLFALQVLVNLYCSSVVTAAAFDAARQVASNPAGETDAIARAQRLAGPKAEFQVQVADDVVAVHVHAENKNFFFGGLNLSALQTVDRTVRVRRECFRSSGDGSASSSTAASAACQS